MACLLAICLTACHKEEQEVAGAAENAVQAEHKAQAAAQASASEQDRERAELALIPLPTKSMYVNVRDAGAWANPFLSVGASSLSLRISVTGAIPARRARLAVRTPSPPITTRSSCAPPIWPRP